MLGKIYLNLLLLCGVLCQGIIGTLSEEDIGESSELLVREKRVINHTPGGDVRQMIKYFPYLVLIREFSHPNFCPGSILSERIVLTAAKCIELRIDAYKVHSGSSRLSLGGNYMSHNIMDKKVYRNTHRLRVDDGVGLISVHPPFHFTHYTQSIPLYEGHLYPGTLVTVSGWGCHEKPPYGTQHPENLRSIVVPIISFEQCANLYRNLFPITRADICTLDPSELRYCGFRDAGAPLVVEVNSQAYLAGVHLWNGGVVGHTNPDVYVNLQSPEYRSWILEKKRIMEERVLHQGGTSHS